MITDKEFIRIAGFMKRRYGIDLTNKKAIVSGKLENYVRNGKWESFDDFMNDVESDSTGTQEKMLVNFLTTNHTYFMREFEHFDYFRTVVLPWMKRRESASKDLRVWCGAASSGEEPYTIAMTMRDFLGLEHEQWDATILATDISTKVLKQAAQGAYEAGRVATLPDNWKRHYFRPIAGGSQYQVKEELKQQVLFRQFNLMNSFPFKKKMHAIFLRNVMIYFDDRTKQELTQKVYDALLPGGYFFIGTTETLDRSNTPFQIVRPSIFRKEGE